MKKTLLCFLFLFTSIFYSQVTSITTCGNTPFNLTSVNSDFIGNLNPAETTVSYYLSFDDALNNTNAIANTTAYSGAAGTTKIYGRVDNNGNITTNYFNLTVIEPLVVTALHQPILCKGNTTSLTINVSGGNGFYLYSINGSAFTSNNSYNNLPAGVYTISVQSLNSVCPDVTIAYTITEPDVLVATSMIVDQNTIITTAVGGTAPYTYSLDGISYQPNNFFPNLNPGSYTVRVKDSNGCIAIVQTNVLPSLNGVAVIVKELDCTSNNGAVINAYATGGQAPYTYSIDNGITYQASNVFNLNAGTYFLRIRDALNTVANTGVIVINPLVPVNGTVVVTNATSCSNGAITVQAATGQAPYFYSIDNGVTYTSSNIFNNLSAGNYTLSIRDSKGCISAAINAVIQQTASLSATASHIPLFCAKDKTSLTISATGGQAPYQYSLNNGSYTSSNVYTNLDAGIYNVLVKDANGCLLTFEYIITQPMPIYPDFIINGQDLTITGQGGAAPYQYSVDSAPFQTVNVFTNLSSGIHFIKLKDANGCESYDFTVNIEGPLPLAASVSITKPLDCVSNATIEVNASGGVPPYLYSINGTAYQNNTVFTILSAGTYVVSVKDAANTVLNTNSIVINPLVPVAANAIITKPIDCNGNALINVTATGGQTPYLYSFDGGITYTGTNVFSNASAGTYTILVKDSNGCISALTPVTIQPYLPLKITAAISKPVDCTNGTIVGTTSGGTSPYQYSINNEAYINLAFFSKPAGTYTINVKDANGCIYSTAITLSPYTPVTFTPTVVNATCSSTSNGSISINARGGVAPYTYSLNNNPTYQSSNNFTNLAGGTYTISVKDSRNCIVRQFVNITQPASLVINTTVNNVTCPGSNNGAITLNVTGGKAPYSYSKDAGMTYTSNTTFNSLTAGVYNFYIKDSNNCITSYNAIITQPDALVMNITIVNDTNDENIATKISLVSSGGTAPYKYTIKNKITGEIVAENKKITSWSGFREGLYSFTVIDANGCTAENDNVTVKITSPIILNAVRTPISCTNNYASLSVNPSGGVPPYLYMNLPGGTAYTANNPGMTNLTSGINTIMVIDAAGNEAQAHITVKPYVAATINTAITNTNCYGGSDGSITITATEGITPYTYSVGNGYGTTNIFTNLTAKTYTVSVKDAAGCISTSNVVISQPNSLTVSTVITNSATIDSNDGKITVTASNGTAPYTYSVIDQNGTMVISSQSSNVLTNLPMGTFNLQVVDAKGCTVTRTGLKITSTLVTATTVVTPVTCTSLGTITVNTVGGILPFVYSFNNGISWGVSNVAENLNPGNYIIKVKDTQNNIVNVLATIAPLEPLAITAALVSEIKCYGSNNAVIHLTAIGGKAPYYYSLNGNSYQSVNIFSNLSAGDYLINVKDSNDCTMSMVYTVTQPSSLISTVEIKNQTITVNAQGGTGEIRYAISPDLNIFSTNNTFTNLTSGIYTVIVKDQNGCSILWEILVNPPAPVAENQNENIFEFKPGQTLADIIIEGENIKWYSSQNTPTSKTLETILPLTTVLVDGVTYYASQTVNGIESKDRLAVTAKLNRSLSTPDFNLLGFKFYPNPVKNILTVNNTSVIDEVQVLSISGESVLFKKINNTYSEIDLSNLSTGVYILKVKADGKQKGVKFIKE